MAPTHRRGPWVPEEDQLLLQLVREQGPNNWVRISQHMHYRSPKQCRERFHQNLKPSLNRAPISAEEGLEIERLVNEMGKRWAEIARRLGNRSDNAVKNWWNGSMNRKRRGVGGSGSSGAFGITTARAGGYSPSRTCNGRVETPYPRASTTTTITSPSMSYHRPDSSWRSTTTTTTITTTTTTSKPSSRIDRPAPITVFPGDLPSVEHRDLSSPNQMNPFFKFPCSSSSSINRPIEFSLPSPAYSDVSIAPSLVSDHNSISSSSSPRIIHSHSPQLLPLPVDMRQHYSELRRKSLPSLLVPDDSYSHHHLFSSSSSSSSSSFSGISPSKTLEPISELATRPISASASTSSASPSWNHNHQRQYQHQHQHQHTLSWGSAPKKIQQHRQPPRDCRISLDKLLN